MNVEMPMTEPDAHWCWDLFCRVVDNYGDAGVCWRLARELAARGQQVRLWIDEIEALARLWPDVRCQAEPQQVAGVTVAHWSLAEAETPGEVVIEAFACELPAGWLARLRQCPRPPVWLNLEYLSAEDWVAGCHGLTSPQQGLSKYFFFPGFDATSGGLPRERGLIAARDAWQTGAVAHWRRQHGIAGEALAVSLFAYTVPAALVDAWCAGPQPVYCLVPAGWALDQLCSLLRIELLAPGQSACRGALTVQALPFLRQDEYDRLLWSCDLNLVRGEDSFVRAQWAARPLVWQIYRQDEDAHLVKLQAFLDRYLAALPSSVAEDMRRFWLAYNGVGEPDWPAFAARLATQRKHAVLWSAHLQSQGELVANLVSFVRSKLE